LEPSVPEDVAFLFEVTRGSMVYGMFFLPLASLATEQCYRVLEAGARRRCKQLGLMKMKPGKRKALPDTPFAELVAALKRADKIPEGDLHAWDTMPFLRNHFSHPTSQLLGETIGIELELESQEKDVGPFRADILCKDTANDNWVLIENQLERTDHSHLGQLITYAAGLNAVTIVWIAERFTDEHRACKPRTGSASPRTRSRNSCVA